MLIRSQFQALMWPTTITKTGIRERTAIIIQTNKTKDKRKIQLLILPVAMELRKLRRVRRIRLSMSATEIITRPIATEAETEVAPVATAGPHNPFYRPRLHYLRPHLRATNLLSTFNLFKGIPTMPFFIFYPRAAQRARL